MTYKEQAITRWKDGSIHNAQLLVVFAHANDAVHDENDGRAQHNVPEFG